jgi:hypothetical protein
MARNLAQLVDVVEQALGGTPDPRVAAKGVINEAGRHLVTMHRWKFLERPTFTGAFVADQGYVTLPVDFEQLISVETFDDALNTVTVVSRADLEALRAAPIQTTLDRYVAVEYPTQTSATASPVGARLALWPVPSASVANGLRIVYRAGWVELSDNAAYPNVPVDLEGLLLEIARAIAQGRRAGDIGVIRRLDMIDASGMVNRLKQHFGTVQANLGSLQGGVATYDSGGIYRPFSSINTSG